MTNVTTAIQIEQQPSVTEVRPLAFVTGFHEVRPLNPAYLERLRRKIREIGAKPYPLSVTRAGILYGGRHRYEAFKAEGLTECLMHIADPANLDREAIELNITDSTTHGAFMREGGHNGKLPGTSEKREGTVYFLLGRQTNLLKIGFASHLDERINSIQAMTPDILDLVKTIPGTIQIERQLHKDFADYRAHGEWFRCVGFLAKFVGKGDAK